MYPILLNFGPITIHSFGLFLMLGFILGSFWFWRKGREEFEEEKLLDATLVLVTFSVLGARIFYILLHFQNFGFNILRWIHFYLYPGFVFWGGVTGGIFGIFIYTRLAKISFWRISDFLAFGASLGYFFGQIGCFLDGCVLGKTTNSILGLVPVVSLEKRSPVALYEILAALVIFLILRWIYQLIFVQKRRREGSLFLSFLALLSLFSFPFEFLRENVLYFGRLSLNQWFALIFFTGAMSSLYVRLRNISQDFLFFVAFLRAKAPKLRSKK